MKKQKKSNLTLVVIAVVVVCAALISLLWKKDPGSSDDPNNSASAAKVLDSSDTSGSEEAQEIASTKESQVIAPGDSLVIPVSEVTETAQFYPVNVDGTEMEVIAVRDSKGDIRTAFNTCQVCYSSGRGYYEQRGDYLVCQNCGNSFTAEQVEVSAGGCNPYPIFEEDKTVTEDSIEISYDFLKESGSIFENWKY